LSTEIHSANWSILHPENVNEKNVQAVLDRLTDVAHEWEDFPWYLVGRLVELLEKPEKSFEYYHVAAYFRARAAMLALKGDVLDRGDLFSALAKYRVQIGGIYRENVLFRLRAFMRKHNLAKLPDCNKECFDPFCEPDQAETNRDLIKSVMQWAERDYVSTLTFISVATEMKQQYCRHSVEVWVAGVDMPPPLGVLMRVKRDKFGYQLRPTQEEAERVMRAGRRIHGLRVRLQEELGIAAPEGGRREEGIVTTLTPTLSPPRERERSAGAETGSYIGEEKSESGRPEARVIADFKAIILPSGNKMLLSRKHKRRAFLRAVHRWCLAKNTDSFFWQDVVEEHNSEFKHPHQRHRRIGCDRIDDDLFKGQKGDFDEIFELLDRAAGHVLLKVKFVLSKPD
jgi:hypothetical protein